MESKPKSKKFAHRNHIAQYDVHSQNGPTQLNNTSNNNNNSEEFVELLVSDINVLYGLWSHFPFIYKVGEQQSGVGPVLLQQVCKERGWREFSHLNTDSYGNSLQGWNLHWVSGKLSSKNIYSWQISNHSNFYSNGHSNYSFTMKNGCSRYLRRLQNSFGSAFDFGPLTFNLPSDYSRLCSEHSRRKKEFMSKLFAWEFEISLQQQQLEQSNNISTTASSVDYDCCYMLNKLHDPPIRPIWICKPVGKSRGRGIVIFDSPEKLNYMKNCVVQEYITRPFLIGGYKWDLRLYVCIVCRAPLVIYTYSEGLVRFSTSKFNLNHLSNIFSHLTNTSVNRESPEYLEVKTEIGKGCKWPLRKLRSYFKSHNLNDWYLWQRIWKVIVLTIIGDTSNICKTESLGHHFDLLGFDIIVDENLKPYLLEVNSNPALSLDCEVDELVKKPMLHELFDLLGLPDSSYFQSDHNSATQLYETAMSHVHSDGIEKNINGNCGIENNFPEMIELPSSLSPFQTEFDNTTQYSSRDGSNRRSSIQSLNDDNRRTSSSSSCSNISLGSQVPHFVNGVAHLAGATNAFNEIITMASKPNLKLRRQNILMDNNSSTANILDYDSLFQQLYNNNNSPMAHYRENPYFQTVGSPGQMQIHPPMHVRIPIKKRPCRVRYPKNYLDKWRTGMFYKVRDWAKRSSPCGSEAGTRDAACPAQVGGWIRTYPFDHTTHSLSYNSKNFDIRSAIQHINNYMRIAREVSTTKIPTTIDKRKISVGNNDVFLNSCTSTNPVDHFYDELLRKLMKLNTKVWHPELKSTLSSNSRM